MKTTKTPLPPWLDRARFPFAPELVEVGDGEVLSVTVVGEGPTVVFSHGTPTWSYEWRHMLAGLAGRFRVVAPDHLGFGLSPRPATADYRPEAHARRFGALLDRLGIDEHHLVVHDYGGPIALEAALERPERVRSLTAINTFAWSFLDDPATARAARLAGGRLARWAYGALDLSFLLARSAWGDRGTLTRATFAPYRAVFPDAASRRQVLWALAQGLGGSAGFLDALWQRRDRLGRTPAHVLWGLADRALPPAALARLTRAFPHASVHTLPRAGHWPHEEEPEISTRSVAAFLDGQPR